MTPDRLLESNQQFWKAWQIFARSAPQGAALDLPGLAIADSRASWPILNAALLSEPVATAADLDRRIAQAVDYFRPTRRMWIFVACDDWLPAGLRATAAERFRPAGLEPEVQVTGMAAERILPPVRPLPSLEIRPVDGAETRLAMADINSISYDVPLEWGRESVARESLWRQPGGGFIGYLEGQPVTSTAYFPIDDAIYIALVATINQYRRTGFAETVMRHALREARKRHGIERSVLHATPAGLAIYERMGYEKVTSFTIYLAAAPD